ncbi:hypothetical protein ACEUKD_23920 (plasmid) [Vibrio diabolicus]|nr:MULTISPECIES: hypothetical protein [Vibrio]NAW53149.1 hypothetical protein [Vibrio sp. V41_P2S12T139]NAW94323.1 hypothetical protein [Vibrio sp. V42_P2S4T144]MCS0323176.1 hypothetical protein [Vibrio diabolicus]NOH90220.1 hypothetical protein [Vibrio alginolyticus]PWF69561.1 hypothetical protein CBX98_20100 [Vibrio sp. T9]
MLTQKVVLSQCELLNRYYDERALSSLPTNGTEPYFQFGDLEWGFDLIQEIEGKPSCMPIPLDKTTVENVFYRSKANYAYVNGNIVITANLPAGTLAEDEQYQFSCVGVKDASGGLILVAVTQPVWIYSDRGLSIEIVINTARTDSAQVAQVGA